MPRQFIELVAVLIALLVLVTSGMVAYYNFDIVVACSVLVIEACLGLILTEIFRRVARATQP